MLLQISYAHEKLIIYHAESETHIHTHISLTLVKNVHRLFYHKLLTAFKEKPFQVEKTNSSEWVSFATTI